jgi:hypothetical protein
MRNTDELLTYSPYESDNVFVHTTAKERRASLAAWKNMPCGCGIDGAIVPLDAPLYKALSLYKWLTLEESIAKYRQSAAGKLDFDQPQN